jgi:hypothetical protein
VAHVLAYGVVKPAFKLWLSSKNEVPPWAEDMIIPKTQQHKMTRRAAHMRSTSCVSCKVPDIVKCASINVLGINALSAPALQLRLAACIPASIRTADVRQKVTVLLLIIHNRTVCCQGMGHCACICLFWLVSFH